MQRCSACWVTWETPGHSLYACIKMCLYNPMSHIISNQQWRYQLLINFVRMIYHHYTLSRNTKWKWLKSLRLERWLSGSEQWLFLQKSQLGFQYRHDSLQSSVIPVLGDWSLRTLETHVVQPIQAGKTLRNINKQISKTKP